MSVRIRQEDRVLWNAALEQAQATAVELADAEMLAQLDLLRAEIELGEVSDASLEIFESYLRMAQNAARFREAALSPEKISRPRLDLTRFESIRVNGIRTAADLELALDYIALVSPELGGELVNACRSSGYVRVVVEPGLQGAANGYAEVLPIDYIDRNAQYQRTVHLREGAKVFTLVHELVHALREEDHPQFLQGSRLPQQASEDLFGDIRANVQRAVFHEESNAFGASFAFYDDAHTRDPNLQLPPDYTDLYQAYEQGGLENLRKNLPTIIPFYERHAKVVGVLTALAVKSGNAMSADFSPTRILDMLSIDTTGLEHGGEIDMNKAFDVLLRLYQVVFSGTDLSTIDAMRAHVGSIAEMAVRFGTQQGNLEDALFAQLDAAMAAHFDGARFRGRQEGLVAALDGAENFGARTLAPDASHDQGYLPDAEMAPVVVNGFSSLMRYVEQLRSKGQVGGPEYNEVLLKLARFSPDPLAGQLFGQAATLAYAQADRYPEMLFDLAQALADAGYAEAGTKALVAYSERMSQKTDSAIDVKSFFALTEKLTPEQKTQVAASYFQHHAASSFTAVAVQVKYGFTFSAQQRVELSKILLDGYPQLDLARFDAFIAQVPGYEPTNLQKLREGFVSSSREHLSKLAQLAYATREFEAQLAGARAGEVLEHLHVLHEQVQAIPAFAKQADAVLDPFPDEVIPSDRTIVERYLRENNTITHFRKKKWATQIALAKDLLFSAEHFELGMAMLAGIPDLPEKLDIFTNEMQVQFNLERLSVAQRLHFLQASHATARAVAERELHEPGITYRETKVYPKHWNEDVAKLAANVSNAEHPLATQLNEVKQYNDYLMQVVRYALIAEDAQLHAFAEQCLQEAGRGRARVHVPSTASSGEHRSMVPLERRAEWLVGTVSNTPHPERFERAHLAAMLDFYGAALRQAQSHEEIAKDVDVQRAIAALPEVCLRAGQLDLAVEALSLARQLPMMQEGFPFFRYHDSAQAEQKSFARVELLLDFARVYDADYDGFQEKLAAFSAELERDLKSGRQHYSTDELLQLSRSLQRIPDLAELNVLILSRAVDRHVARWGERKIIDPKGNGKKKISVYNDNVGASTVVQALEHASIDDVQRDKLLARYFDGLITVAQHSGANVADILAAINALDQYREAGRFPQTDRVLYHRAAELFNMLPLVGDRVRQPDMLKAVHRFLGQYLRENPWLQDPRAQAELQTHSVDHSYRRNLAALYPHTRTQEPVMLANGELNLEAARFGLVDQKTFCKEVLERLADGRLQAEAAQASVAAAVEASVADSELKGDISEIRKHVLFIDQLWARFIEHGTSPVAESCLRGLVDGLSRHSPTDRLLFFAELLEGPSRSLELKRHVWQSLREAEITPVFAEHFLRREVLPGRSTLREAEFYHLFGQLYLQHRGKIPPKWLPALLLQHPEEIGQYQRALAKWSRVLQERQSAARLDFSDVHDVAAFHSLLKPASKSLDLMSSLHSGMTVEGCKIVIFASDSAKRLDKGGYHLHLQHAEDWGVLEAVKLPALVEKFPPDARKLFQAIFLKLPAGDSTQLLQALDEKVVVSAGEQMRILLTKLGWVKVGQILSVMPSLPAAVRTELAVLQDQVAPSTKAEVLQTLQSELGAFYEQIDLTSIEWPPKKSGSIGEVLHARLKDGREVAIKVCTESRRTAVREMLEVLHQAVELLGEQGVKKLYGIDLPEFHQELSKLFAREMDFGRERRLIEHFEDLPEGMRKPAVFAEAPISASVIVMEWLEGGRLDVTDLPFERRNALVEQFKAFLQRPFQVGNYQGDPHPGNFLLLPDGSTGVLDFGQVQHVTELQLDHVLDLFLAFSNGDAKTIADVLIAMSAHEVTHVSAVQKQVLQEKIAALLAQNKAKANAPGHAMDTFLALLEVAGTSDFPVQAEYRLLLKYYATLEGVIAQLDASFSFLQAMQEVLVAYGKRRYGSAAFTAHALFGKKLPDGQTVLSPRQILLGALFQWDMSEARADDLKEAMLLCLAEIRQRNQGKLAMHELTQLLESLNVEGAEQSYLRAAQGTAYHTVEKAIEQEFGREYKQAYFAWLDYRNPRELAYALLHLKRSLAQPQYDQLHFSNAVNQAARDFFTQLVNQVHQGSGASLGELFLQSVQVLRRELSAVAEERLHQELLATCPQSLQAFLEAAWNGEALQVADPVQLARALQGSGLISSFVPYHVVQMSEPEMREVAKVHRIPLELMPQVLLHISSDRYVESINQQIQQKITPDAIQNWLETEDGTKWLEQNKDVLRNRMRQGLPSLSVGVVGLLGAEQLADILGLDQRYHQVERFAFVVAASHLANKGAQSVLKVTMSQSSLPLQVVNCAMLEEGGAKSLQLVLQENGSVVSEGMLAALQQNFSSGRKAAVTVLQGGVKVLKFPYAMSMGMGMGLFSAKITELVLPANFPGHDKIMFMSFFAPEIRKILFGNVHNKALSTTGAAVGRVFSAGFLVDLGAMGLSKFLNGESYSYEQSVNMRASEKKDEAEGTNSLDADDAYVVPLVFKGIDRGLELVAPSSAAWADSSDWIFGKNFYWDQVRAEDAKQAEQMQQGLRDDITFAMIMGNAVQETKPEFYQSVSFQAQDYVAQSGAAEKIYAVMKKVLEKHPNLSGQELAFKMRLEFPYNDDPAYSLTSVIRLLPRLQRRRMLDELHFMDLPVNAEVHAFTDQQGSVLDEDAFYHFVTKNEPEKFAEQIIFVRKVRLATRLLLEKNTQELAKSKALALQVGLLNANGEWQDEAVYLAARQQWAQAQTQEELISYANTLLQKSFDPEQNETAQMLAKRELQVMGVLDPKSPLYKIFVKS